MDKSKVWLLFCLLVVLGSYGPSAFATESLIKWQIQSVEPSPSSQESKEQTSTDSSSQEVKQDNSSDPVKQPKLPQTSRVLPKKSTMFLGMMLVSVSCYGYFNRKEDF